MLDFQTKKCPRPSSPFRQRWRLLGLVLGLGFLFIVGEWVVNPEKRRQLMSLTGAAERDDAGGRGGQIENLLPQSGGKTEDGPAVLADEAPPKDAAEDQTGRYFRGVKPGLLEAVADDTPFRPKDLPAWLNLLEVLRKSRQSDIEAASTGSVSYAQLFRQSSQYRGELVSVTGKVRAVKRLRTAANDLGIEHHYECSLWPFDNPQSPLLICCLELPEGFPRGEKIAEEVDVTGFFFKRMEYRDEKGALRTVPMLLAKTFQWKPQPNVSREPDSPNTSVLLAAGGVALLVSIALAVVLYRQMRPRRSPSGERTIAVGPPPDAADSPEKEGMS